MHVALSRSWCSSFLEKDSLPPEFLSFNSLELLDVTNCVISGTMIYLPRLRSARLSAVEISEATLNGIVSNAKDLDSLVLRCNAGHSTLSLNIPQLQSLIVSVDSTIWFGEEQLLKLYIESHASFERLLVSTVSEDMLSVTISGQYVPPVLGYVGSRLISFHHGKTKLEGMAVRHMNVANHWDNVKNISIQLELSQANALEEFLVLFRQLNTLHIILKDPSTVKDVETLGLSCNTNKPFCMTLKKVVMHCYAGLREQAELARSFLETAKMLRILLLETETRMPMDWLKEQRYELNFDGRASQRAEVNFTSEGDARHPSVEELINAADPFLMRYVMAYHTIVPEEPIHILQSEFLITKVNVLNQNSPPLFQLNGTQFDEVSEVEAESEDFDMHLQLDVATWVYDVIVAASIRTVPLHCESLSTACRARYTIS